MKELSAIKSANIGYKFVGYQKIGQGYLFNEDNEKVYCTIFSMPNSMYYKVCIFKPSNMGFNWNLYKEAKREHMCDVHWTEKCFVIEAQLPYTLPVGGIAKTLAGLIDFKF